MASFRHWPLAALMACAYWGGGAVLEGRPRFTEVSAEAGIDYQHDGGAGSGPSMSAQFQQTYMSGGAAAGDYDGDGWVDLFVTRQSAPGILYRNNGDGTFEDVTAEAFEPNAMRGVRSNGPAWGDIDNDGDLDLYVTTMEYPRHLLFINDGAGRFTEEAVERGADVPDANGHPRYGFSASFGDYDGDGYLDLHVTEWRLTDQILPFDVSIPPRDQVPAGELEEWQALYDRYVLAQHNTRLLRNRGAEAPGHFEDVTEAAGVAVERVPSNADELTNSEAFASRFSDMDRDGHPDLLIASDHKTSRLYWNNGDGTFTDGTEASGVGTDRNGMGSALGDYDGDGDLDWFVTSIYEEGWETQTPEHLARDGNRLFRYDGDRQFSDVTDEAGVRDGQWGWGAAFIDFDNDGDLDLTMTNGIGFETPYRTDRSVFWENDGSGRFADVSEEVGFADIRSGKGLLVFDYDRDGDLDIFIANNPNRLASGRFTQSPHGPLLYRNDGGDESNWLRIELVGTVSNRQAAGAFVTLRIDGGDPDRVQVREVNLGSHYLGQSETALHFGLGEAETVDEVEIEWPDGAVTYHEGLSANESYVFQQPSAVGWSREVGELELWLGDATDLGFGFTLPPETLEVEGLPEGIELLDTGVLQGSPREWGRFEAVVRIGHAYGSSEIPLELTVLARYESWAALHFEDGSANVGPWDDFDADGRSNFREYAELTDPMAVDAGRGLQVGMGESEPVWEWSVFRYAGDLLLDLQRAPGPTAAEFWGAARLRLAFERRGDDLARGTIGATDGGSGFLRLVYGKGPDLETQ